MAKTSYISMFVVLAHETTVQGKTCRSTQTHYPESEPTSLCSCSLMLHG